MNWKCEILGHSMAPANPLFHEFLGSVCTRCGIEERTICNAETRKLHYLCKSTIRKMNFLHTIPHSEELR